MLKIVMRVLFTIISFVGGYELFKVAFPSLMVATGYPLPLTTTPFSVMGGTIFGLIFYFITPSIVDHVGKLASWTNNKMKSIPTQDIVLGVVGLIIALLIGVLLNFPLSRIPWVGPYLSLAVTLVLAYLGVTFILNRKDEFSLVSSHIIRRPGYQEKRKSSSVKVLDTSVIIDGRIMDISNTGFVEGELIVPGFVLEELRHIADSPDLLKRNRGRRGLDILNKMQKEMAVEVKIVNKDYEDISEVDSKLIKLAQDMGGIIVTNDFNLNKVCELQGVFVLNVNELANAVKPIVLPGEEMSAHIIKDGKETGQGVAYLDDGTMIVVEGGRRFIGETVEVLVTSVLQTAAGRMIFAKPKNNTAEKISLKQ
ncbi:MAG: PIN/TRAM domain-containing protein [Bacillota bacterium]|nr:PIN/TRAM domain-containing protein [Bacillota bacterium]